MNAALREPESRGGEGKAGRQDGSGRDTGGICVRCQGENKLKETDPMSEKWRSLLGSYHCNAAQCQKRSCVCCRFITFQRH